MSPLMMSGREMRNVPADFHTPIGKTWEGWFNPDPETPCGHCGSSGYSPTARWLQSTFYDHNTADGGWGSRLLQHDVDALIEAGRLRVPTGRSLPTARHPHGVQQWMRSRVTAEEINATRSVHDGINVYVLVEYRCGLLKAPVTCAECDGQGGTYRDDEHRAACEAWDPQPPTGDHIQLWQTVSEGGPVSPIFPDSPAGRVALAGWMAVNDTSIHRGLSEDDWLRLIGSEVSAIDIATGALVLPAPAPVDGGSDDAQ